MNFENSINMPDEKVLLACEPSIFSMTFDELQMTGGLGKDFGSMNMEDLLKNIWTVEETEGNSIVGVIANGLDENLQRQGSLTFPRTLCVRTIEEVWNELLKENGVPKDGTGVRFSIQSEPTLGEIALEEFLARAGVDNEDIKPLENSCNVGSYGDHVPPINGNNYESIFGLRPIADEIMGNSKGVSSSSNNNMSRSSNQHQQSQPLLQPIFPEQKPNEIISMVGLQGVSCVTTPMTKESPRDEHHTYMTYKTNLDASYLSSSRDFNQVGRGRRYSSTIDKPFERRERRMIKNRESATRSRARKQAYTLELEEEVAKLKEDNKELMKHQVELKEIQKKKILESLKRPQGADRRSLRRTMTEPW